MRLFKATIALLTAGLIALPVAATIVPAGSKGIVFAPFVTATQGTLLASQMISGQSFTFAGDLSVAVYRNTLGTLDFYYQFSRTGNGTTGNDAVETITGANYEGFLVDAMFSDGDVDGAGIFTASNNPGTPATAQRNTSGGVLGIDFAPLNPVSGHEVSGTYIFRTDATSYSVGTFGVIDGATFQGLAYQPSSSAVPESATWALFLAGFGTIGARLRKSGRTDKAAA
jgi:hypothetical protein